MGSWDHFEDGSFDAFAELTARRGNRTARATVSVVRTPQTVTLLGRTIRIVATTRDGLVLEA
ncbi:MAG: hypothetical protein R3B82_14030 [Sandaracinaceae bacterium]